MTDAVQMAMEKMVHWLEHPNEFGRRPGRIQCTNQFDRAVGNTCFIFRFKKSLFSSWCVGIVSESGTFSHLQVYKKKNERRDAE